MHKTDSTVFIPSDSVYQQKAPITTIQKLCRCYFLLYAGIYLIKPHILGAIFEKKKILRTEFHLKIFWITIWKHKKEKYLRSQ